MKTEAEIRTTDHRAQARPIATFAPLYRRPPRATLQAKLHQSIAIARQKLGREAHP